MGGEGAAPQPGNAWDLRDVHVIQQVRGRGPGGQSGGGRGRQSSLPDEEGRPRPCLKLGSWRRGAGGGGGQGGGLAAFGPIWLCPTWSPGPALHAKLLSP